MADTALIFELFFVSFSALFLNYIKILMVAGLALYIIKGLAEFIYK